ncbi:MAG: hypothetical protein HXY43_25350 [Fischerella sp.]|uniref:hypothetical protein n=1 Tax=Fischerella sp. TaxID=1191 RepID=UPI0017B23D97|nr:hypothetical protein [Fischerella sp.]NWF62473.1 hypothetical protein [Fischerella sp.]
MLPTLKLSSPTSRHLLPTSRYLFDLRQCAVRSLKGKSQKPDFFEKLGFYRLQLSQIK